MIQNGLLDALAARTDKGGQLCFRSDDRSYFDWTMELLEAHPCWEVNASADWPLEMETYFQSLMEQYDSVVACVAVRLADVEPQKFKQSCVMRAAAKSA